MHPVGGSTPFFAYRRAAAGIAPAGQMCIRDRAYITHFLADLQADCFLPALDASPSWRLLEKQQPFVHEDLHCCFALYENLAPLPIA